MDGGTPSSQCSGDGRSAVWDHARQSPSRVQAPSEVFPFLPASTDPAPSDAIDDDEASGPENGHHGGIASTGTPTNGISKAQVDAQGRTLNPRSCVTCRKRKVKCNKVHPCSNCNRAHIECVFPAPGRAPRKARKLGEGKDKELLERLRRLEGVVKGLGVEVPPDGEVGTAGSQTEDTQRRLPSAADNGSSAAQTQPNSNRDTPQREKDPDEGFRSKTRYIEEHRGGRFENRFGRLVINEGKSRYINNSFWANLSNEVEDLKGILNQSSDEEDDAEPGGGPGINHQGWIFGFSSGNVDMLSLHPLPGQLPAYWDAFKDRVDPLVKVLHIPTIEPVVLSAAAHLPNLSRSSECLLFAIYYGAVTSLTPQDCQARFNEEKQVLLSRYRFAIEQSLARANFLTTEEIVVLQAFVIFLICLRRNHDARVIWTLTGLVVRIAQTLGIHRDGTHFGLSPFEIEMRRRLWWQICVLDVRASEDHGCDPTIIEQAFDTKMPLNINDVDIRPDDKDFPPERQGCTDLAFCLIRFEVANTFRRINYIPPGSSRACGDHFSSVTLQDKEKWITECHQRLEERYLRHCDMSVPLFWVTATVARLMMSKMWLMVYHPFQRHDGGASLPSETKDKLFITSLENIEYSLLLETEARTMKWGWLFRTYMQWHALAFMLSELCHRTQGDLVERAWIAVEKTRDGRWGRPLTDDNRAGHLWRPLKKLYRKAKDARQRGIAEEMRTKQGVMVTAANGQPVIIGGTQPSRTYSPNANSMFGHPTRPTMTRAPLSQAQLQRFTEGPTYGVVPLDKHELLKSPKILQDTSGAEVDPMETAGLNNEPAMGQTYYPNDLPPSQPQQHPQQPFTDASQQPPYAWMPTAPPFDPNVAFPPPGDPNNINFPPMRMDSIDSNGLPDFSMDPDISTGDLNWDNFDELVRQYGMDMDTTFDRRPGNLSYAEGGQVDQDPSVTVWNQAQLPPQGNAMQQNLRMGMGMGGGDWF